MDLIWDGLKEAIELIFTGDAYVYEVAFTSLYVSGSATLIAVVIGFAIASLLVFRAPPGRTLALSAFNAGMALPPVAVGLVVAIMLWRTGPLGALGAAGADAPPGLGGVLEDGERVLRRFEEADGVDTGGGGHAAGDEYAGDGGVHAGLEHEEPEEDAADDVGDEAADLEDVEQGEGADKEGGVGEGVEVEALGVEGGDDEEGAEVVDDREGDEEDLE